MKHVSGPNVTIEAAQNIIPSRYTIMRVASLRVREIMAGAKPHPDVDRRLTDEYRRTTLPGSRAIKVALNEIEKGKVPFTQNTVIPDDEILLDEVFTAYYTKRNHVLHSS